MREELTDGRVVELIQAAVFSGAYSGLVRQHPDARGLERLREKWSMRVTALANEICAGVRQDGTGATPATLPPRVK